MLWQKLLTRQSDHLSRKPVNVREFNTGQEKDNVWPKSYRNAREKLVGELFIANFLFGAKLVF